MNPHFSSFELILFNYRYILNVLLNTIKQKQIMDKAYFTNSLTQVYEIHRIESSVKSHHPVIIR